MTAAETPWSASLADWSAVVADGPDAASFLQGFCTNDVAALAEGEACEAFFTDVKARVVAYGWVHRGDGRCVVLLSSARAPKLAEHLDRYLLRDRVELTVPAWRFAMSASRPDDDGLWIPTTAYGASAGVVTGGATASAANEISADEFEALRIRLGAPRDGVDVDERNLPQEVDRNDRAISFTKGCYLGQEPVARIDALGCVNWLLRGLRFESTDGLARDAELLREGKPVGRVTSFAAEGDGAIGLGYVRRESASDGERLRLGGAEVVVADQ